MRITLLLHDRRFFLPRILSCGCFLFLSLPLLLGGLFLCPSVHAAQTPVTLQWDGVPGTGIFYKVFTRLEGQSYNYDAPVWTGATTTCTVQVADDVPCFFVVRSADDNGNESADSNEAEYQPPVDTDGDGITDADETNIYGTDPNLADTDGDGINDGAELAYWGGNWNQDFDSDGIINLLDYDSDGNGISDGADKIAQEAQPDFNQDGKRDILWRNSSTGQLAIWLMDGPNYGSSTSPGTVSDLNWQIVDTADFNQDGKTDILWRDSSTGQLAIWLMDGPNYSSSTSPGTVSNLNWQIVDTADFNQDGKPDILWRDSSTGQLAIWLMDGPNYGSSTSPGTVSDLNWQIVDTADFNQDGKPDILWRNSSSGQLAIWLMDGPGYGSSTSPGTVSDTNWQIQK